MIHGPQQALFLFKGFAPRKGEISRRRLHATKYPLMIHGPQQALFLFNGFAPRKGEISRRRLHAILGLRRLFSYHNITPNSQVYIAGLEYNPKISFYNKILKTKNHLSFSSGTNKHIQTGELMNTNDIFTLILAIYGAALSSYLAVKESQ
jgi:hypothetical protein